MIRNLRNVLIEGAKCENCTWSAKTGLGSLVCLLKPPVAVQTKSSLEHNSSYLDIQAHSSCSEWQNDYVIDLNGIEATEIRCENLMLGRTKLQELVRKKNKRIRQLNAKLKGK